MQAAYFGDGWAPPSCEGWPIKQKQQSIGIEVKISKKNFCKPYCSVAFFDVFKDPVQHLSVLLIGPGGRCGAITVDHLLCFR